MSSPSKMSSTTVSPDIARRVFARATEIDAGNDGALTVQQIEEIANEVGISQSAVLAALREHSNSSIASLPIWVRLGTLGVPDRQTALRFYWLSVATTCLSPFLLLVPSTRPMGICIALVVGIFSFANVFGTSRAIRWLDRHGWERLP